MAGPGRILVPGLYSSEESDDDETAASTPIKNAEEAVHDEQNEEELDTADINPPEADETAKEGSEIEEGADSPEFYEMPISDYAAVGTSRDTKDDDEEQYVPTKGTGSVERLRQVHGNVSSRPPVERQYFMVIDIQKRMVRVKETPVDESSYVKLEPITHEEYSKMGVKVRESELDEDDDNYIHCDLCVSFYVASCLTHPLYRILDRPVPDPVADRAKRTLPPFLNIRDSPIAGLGVFTTVNIPTGCTFGPYQGVLVEDAKKADSKGYSWEIRLPGSNVYLDGSDTKYSNWMRYINSSRYEREQNLIAFQYNGSVYYRVFRPINQKDELLVWYGSKYGASLGVLSTRSSFAKSKYPPLSYNKNPFIL